MWGGGAGAAARGWAMRVYAQGSRGTTPSTPPTPGGLLGEILRLVKHGPREPMDSMSYADERRRPLDAPAADSLAAAMASRVAPIDSKVSLHLLLLTLASYTIRTALDSSQYPRLSHPSPSRDVLVRRVTAI